MRDPDMPGPNDAAVFVDSMLEQAFDNVAGMPFDAAAQRFATIATDFEQGLIERFNFTSEQAHAAAREFLTRAMDAWQQEVLAQAQTRGSA